MRPQVLLVTLAVLAALPLISNAGSVEEEGGAAAVAGDAVNARSWPWPCCDNCSMCNRMNPPACQCRDFLYQGCHPACRNCIKYTSNNEPPVYRCADILTNFCKRRCTPRSAAAI